MHRIDHLQDYYCKDCSIKHHLIKSESRTSAHQYCITMCTIGHKIQTLGLNLSHKGAYDENY